MQGNGSVSNEEMEKNVRSTYDIFNSRRKKEDAIQADFEDVMMLDEIIEKAKRK